MPPFIHLLERGTLSNLFLKSKVNVLTAKLKTCSGSGWGSEGRVLRGRGGGLATVVGRRRRKTTKSRAREAMRLRRPSNPC